MEELDIEVAIFRVIRSPDFPFLQLRPVDIAVGNDQTIGVTEKLNIVDDTLKCENYFKKSYKKLPVYQLH